MSKASLKLDWCSAKAARYAVENWHYSGTLPANKSVYIGAWESGQFIGVIIFGLGASPSLGTRYGLTAMQVCELTRVALRAHKTPVSRMIAIALRMLKSQSPGIRLVVSFADQWHDHHGGIYQAGGWIYAGITSASKMIRLPNGSIADPRRFNGHGHNATKPIPMGSIIIKTPPKHRYLMPLDPEMRAQITPLAKPYPKRAGSADSGMPGNQPGGGGANPTPALSTVPAETRG